MFRQTVLCWNDFMLQHYSHKGDCSGPNFSSKIVAFFPPTWLDIVGLFCGVALTNDKM